MLHFKLLTVLNILEGSTNQSSENKTNCLFGQNSVTKMLCTLGIIWWLQPWNFKLLVLTLFTLLLFNMVKNATKILTRGVKAHIFVDLIQIFHQSPANRNKTQYKFHCTSRSPVLIQVLLSRLLFGITFHCYIPYSFPDTRHRQLIC